MFLDLLVDSWKPEGTAGTMTVHGRRCCMGRQILWNSWFWHMRWKTRWFPVPPSPAHTQQPTLTQPTLTSPHSLTSPHAVQSHDIRMWCMALPAAKSPPPSSLYPGHCWCSLWMAWGNRSLHSPGRLCLRRCTVSSTDVAGETVREIVVGSVCPGVLCCLPMLLVRLCVRLWQALSAQVYCVVYRCCWWDCVSQIILISVVLFLCLRRICS